MFKNLYSNNESFKESVSKFVSSLKKSRTGRGLVLSVVVFPVLKGSQELDSESEINDIPPLPSSLDFADELIPRPVRPMTDLIHQLDSITNPKGGHIVPTEERMASVMVPIEVPKVPIKEPIERMSSIMVPTEVPIQKIIVSKEPLVPTLGLRHSFFNDEGILVPRTSSEVESFYDPIVVKDTIAGGNTYNNIVDTSIFGPAPYSASTVLDNTAPVEHDYVNVTSAVLKDPAPVEPLYENIDYTSSTSVSTMTDIPVKSNSLFSKVKKVLSFKK